MSKKLKKSKKSKSSKSSSKSRKTRKSTPKKTSKKRGIGQAIREYFDEVGVDNALYEESKKRALKVNPNSKYDKSHFSWYKNDYRNREDK